MLCMLTECLTIIKRSIRRRMSVCILRLLQSVSLKPVSHPIQRPVIFRKFKSITCFLTVTQGEVSFELTSLGLTRFRVRCLHEPFDYSDLHYQLSCHFIRYLQYYILETVY